MAKFPHANASKPPFDINEVTLFRPRHVASRIIAQSRIFTAHNKPTDPFVSKDLRNCIIKEECLKELKKLLSTYNVTKAWVFPDHDNIAKFLE